MGHGNVVDEEPPSWAILDQDLNGGGTFGEEPDLGLTFLFSCENLGELFGCGDTKAVDVKGMGKKKAFPGVKLAACEAVESFFVRDQLWMGDKEGSREGGFTLIDEELSPRPIQGRGCGCP
jgi:hypothetical protein